MKRVMIVGQPGAGKSWLARELGAITGLPVHHMDTIHFKPGWVERPRREKVAMARAVEELDEWIFEGGLSATYDTRLRRCDTLIVLDVPLPRRAFRILRRTLRHFGKTRPEMPENCPEKFRPEFWRWVWQTRRSGRDSLQALMQNAGRNVDVFLLHTPEEVRHFLDDARLKPD